ncbi:alpha/beta hydrolase [Spirosoma arcticum]
MKSTFVLVHGAFASQNSWQFIKPILEKEGHTVVMLDLPGHGDDTTPPGQATFDSYVEAVGKVVQAQPGKVVLLGHSMGGMVISAVAEQIPDKLDKLVYLCAYLPKDGEDLQTLGNTDGGSLIGRNLKLATDYSSASLPDDVATQVFASDCSDDIKKLVVSKNRPEPLAPFQAKVSLSAEKFGRVPKYYIETLNDQGVGTSLQKKMIADNGTIKKVYTIATGHTPYWAKPDELAAILNKL